jgi:hypothetical protein
MKEAHRRAKPDRYELSTRLNLNPNEKKPVLVKIMSGGEFKLSAKVKPQEPLPGLPSLDRTEPQARPKPAEPQQPTPEPKTVVETPKEPPKSKK